MREKKETKASQYIIYLLWKKNEFRFRCRLRPEKPTKFRLINFINWKPAVARVWFDWYLWFSFVSRPSLPLFVQRRPTTAHSTTCRLCRQKRTIRKQKLGGQERGGRLRERENKKEKNDVATHPFTWLLYYRIPTASGALIPLQYKHHYASEQKKTKKPYRRRKKNGKKKQKKTAPTCICFCSAPSWTPLRILKKMTNECFTCFF